MRMRRKKHGAERIAACSDLLIQLPEEITEPINPVSFFPQSKPVRLEIGCGKGGFATGLTAQHSEFNLIAMERVADVACIALEKAKYAERAEDNLRFIIGNAQELENAFAPHSIECIYLNFSDPWPKKGYAKRRLTHKSFLEIYRKLLVENGKLIMKTDNVGLFDFSLEQFEEAGITVEWFTRDLHNSEYAVGNIMTEYEKNFLAQGKAICSVQVRF